MSDELINHTVDKTGWPDGPWKQEPDYLQWKHAGYACLIVRNTYGNLCGYVGVDSSHPYYGKHFDECEADVHGGLTYADTCGGHICHVPEPGMPDDVWWLGFDCAHAGDLVPGGYRVLHGGTYRDMGYVQSETQGLAEQLREMMMRNEEIRHAGQ